VEALAKWVDASLVSTGDQNLIYKSLQVKLMKTYEKKTYKNLEKREKLTETC